MGKKFGTEHGSARKRDFEYAKLEMGINKFRLVGELLPRYCYWKKSGEMNMPVECLAFDREEEKFNNLERDWFKNYFPDETCVWSYAIQAIDLNSDEKKIVVFALKKKLYDQIQSLAEELGDPTDGEKGWDIIFEKKKTGPHAFNVEYTLKERAINPRALEADELELLENIKSIDEVLPRQTPEDQKAFIERTWINKEEKDIDEEAKKALEEEDTPF